MSLSVEFKVGSFKVGKLCKWFQRKDYESTGRGRAWLLGEIWIIYQMVTSWIQKAFLHLYEVCLLGKLFVVLKLDGPIISNSWRTKSWSKKKPILIGTFRIFFTIFCRKWAKNSMEFPHFFCLKKTFIWIRLSYLKMATQKRTFFELTFKVATRGFSPICSAWRNPVDDVFLCAHLSFKRLFVSNSW